MFSQDEQKKSMAATEKFGRPLLRKLFGSTTILSTEGHRNRFEQSLDQDCAIDAIIVTDKGLCPIGLRFQFGKNYAATSTRRDRPSKTRVEHDKFKRGISDKSQLIPEFVFHGFVAADEKSADIGVATPQALISVIDKNPNRWRTARNGGETFYFTPWHELPTVQVYRVDDAGHVKDVTNLYRQKNKPLS